jgi:hypothetical protein
MQAFTCMSNAPRLCPSSPSVCAEIAAALCRAESTQANHDWPFSMNTTLAWLLFALVCSWRVPCCVRVCEVRRTVARGHGCGVCREVQRTRSAAHRLLVCDVRSLADAGRAGRGVRRGNRRSLALSACRDLVAVPDWHCHLCADCPGGLWADLSCSTSQASAWASSTSSNGLQPA